MYIIHSDLAIHAGATEGLVIGAMLAVFFIVLAELLPSIYNFLYDFLEKRNQVQKDKNRNESE